MDYIQNLQTVLNGTQVVAILVLILVDFITGVAAALVTGKFDLVKFANFLKTSVLPFFLVYLALGLAAALISKDLLGDFAFILDPVLLNAAWVAIIGVLANSILENVREAGLKVPTLQGMLNKTPLSKNNGK
jgi:phage-related holin